MDAALVGKDARLVKWVGKDLAHRIGRVATGGRVPVGRRVHDIVFQPVRPYPLDKVAHVDRRRVIRVELPA